MKLIYNALIIFIYGIYTELSQLQLKKIIRSNISKSIPLTSQRLIVLSTKNYERRVKFLNMSERFNLEIAKQCQM